MRVLGLNVTIARDEKIKENEISSKIPYRKPDSNNLKIQKSSSIKTNTAQNLKRNSKNKITPNVINGPKKSENITSSVNKASQKHIQCGPKALPRRKPSTCVSSDKNLNSKTKVTPTKVVQFPKPKKDVSSSSESKNFIARNIKRDKRITKDTLPSSVSESRNKTSKPWNYGKRNSSKRCSESEANKGEKKVGDAVNDNCRPDSGIGSSSSTNSESESSPKEIVYPSSAASSKTFELKSATINRNLHLLRKSPQITEHEDNSQKNTVAHDTKKENSQFLQSRIVTKSQESSNSIPTILKDTTINSFPTYPPQLMPKKCSSDSSNLYNKHFPSPRMPLDDTDEDSLHPGYLPMLPRRNTINNIYQNTRINNGGSSNVVKNEPGKIFANFKPPDPRRYSYPRANLGGPLSTSSPLPQFARKIGSVSDIKPLHRKIQNTYANNFLLPPLPPRRKSPDDNWDCFSRSSSSSMSQRSTNSDRSSSTSDGRLPSISEKSTLSPPPEHLEPTSLPWNSVDLPLVTSSNSLVYSPSQVTIHCSTIVHGGCSALYDHYASENSPNSKIILNGNPGEIFKWVPIKKKKLARPFQKAIILKSVSHIKRSLSCSDVRIMMPCKLTLNKSGSLPNLQNGDAGNSKEAVQLEQRLRSLGCELVTLRSILPPAIQNGTNPAQSSMSPNLPNVNHTKDSMKTVMGHLMQGTNGPQVGFSKNPDPHDASREISTMSNSTPKLFPETLKNQDTLHNNQKNKLNSDCPSKGDGFASGVQEVDDLIHLSGPLTEDAVLKSLHARFQSQSFYTNVGPILLSVNPYQAVGNSLTLDSTKSAPQSPHLMRVVHEAVRQQSETGYPQAIILSGACGSGKTYTSMLLLRQLFNVAGGGPETDAFKHLSAAFTVLRSLGSAKTAANKESSRIGHFIEVQVTDGALYRTKIHCYFLNQTRVVKQKPEEKNYHIFYQMLAGLTKEERVKLHLEGHNLRTLRYLSEGDTSQDEAKDAKRFETWKACLSVLGIPFLDVVRVLAAVLLLGNVKFIEGKGVEVAIQGGTMELKNVSSLLGVSSAALYEGLTTRTHHVRGQVVKSMCDANMSNMTRDALAKALYCRTVATIVRRANSLKRLGSTSGTLSSDSNESVHHHADVASQHASTVGTGGSKASKSMAVLNTAVKHATDGFIGILDMFGFEDPQPASLEHLCINLCAETMQHFYNSHIFKSSIESCREEGIVCEVEVDYVNNVPCIDIISSLRTGLLSLLDQECAARSNPENYIQKVRVQHKGNSRLFEPKTNLARTFGIHHFAGNVVYDVSNFLDTNKDVISDDLVSVFQKPSCNFGFATHIFGSEMKALFAHEPVPRGVSFRISPTSHTDLQNGDEPVSTLTQDFHTRLDNLLRTLVHAKPHFVRCIRANAKHKPLLFDRTTVIKQIRALQVLETVNLMAGGFPHRMRFKSFCTRYRLLASSKRLKRVEDKTLEDSKVILEYFVKRLEQITRPSNISIQWALGKRHIFLSEGARQQLEFFRIQTSHRAATIIQAVWRGWTLCRRWPMLRRTLEMRVRTKTSVRPRPQPISGTPPPDALDKCSQKTIQQTCSFFGLDLERPPPVPPSRSYTITGAQKVGYPQSRQMKMTYPEDPNADVIMRKGQTVSVVGVSTRRGHLLVEYQGHTLSVPYQYLEFKPVSSGVNI